MRRVGAVAVAIAVVGLAGCGSSSDGKSQATRTTGTSTTTSAATTTSLPPVTAPQSTTTTIGVMEYAVADLAVDKTAKALNLTLSPDTYQCVLVAWIRRSSRTERDAMLGSPPTPPTEDASRRHLAGAFAQCLTRADEHTAIISLIADSHRKNGECVATRFETYHLAPERVYLGLLLGFAAVSPEANNEFEATLRDCGA